ncbi:hypothetical protein JCM10908_001398 [Rhodotorula pacifica]|uniref:uncharacterized protein n=1 Tax=Rhodotorula pacifica TaxID=1495444 RepID=UPI003173D60B
MPVNNPLVPPVNPPKRLDIPSCLGNLAALAIGEKKRWDQRHKFSDDPAIAIVSRWYEQACGRVREYLPRNQSKNEALRELRIRVWHWLTTKQRTLELALGGLRISVMDALSQVVQIDMAELFHAFTTPGTRQPGIGAHGNTSVEAAQWQELVSVIYGIWGNRREALFAVLAARGQIPPPHRALRSHLAYTERTSLEWVLTGVYTNLKSCIERGDAAGAQNLTQFWTAEFILQRSLGTNPAFDFGGYDAEMEGGAAWPVWRNEQWYRQPATPFATPPGSPTSASVPWAKGPFLDTPPPALYSPWCGIWIATSRAAPVPHSANVYPGSHHGPAPGQPGSYAELARIGLRAQRQYRIKPDAWNSRWSSDQ